MSSASDDSDLRPKKSIFRKFGRGRKSTEEESDQGDTTAPTADQVNESEDVDSDVDSIYSVPAPREVSRGVAPLAPEPAKAKKEPRTLRRIRAESPTGSGGSMTSILLVDVVFVTDNESGNPAPLKRLDSFKHLKNMAKRMLEQVITDVLYTVPDQSDHYRCQ